MPNMCDRCFNATSCSLNYLGKCCKERREKECPDVRHENRDRILDADGVEELAARLTAMVKALEPKTRITRTAIRAYLTQPAPED